MVLRPSGRLRQGEGLTRLRREVEDRIAVGQQRIVVNLDAVRDLDPLALIAMLPSSVRLVSSGARRHDLLAFAKLLPVFQCFEQERAAMESFEHPGSRRHAASAHI